jgi:type IV pilus assembly protein PilO
MGEFISGIAALPRIVTLHDITIKTDDKDSYDVLSFELTAKTYRYLDDTEVAAEKSKSAPSEKGKKGKSKAKADANSKSASAG